MIDWNGNGKIDPEEFIITDIILGEDEEGEEKHPKKPRGGCLMSLLILPVLAIKALIM